MVHIVCRQLERVRGACWRVDGVLTRADAARLQLVCRPFAHECALGWPSCKGRDKLHCCRCSLGRHGQPSKTSPAAAAAATTEQLAFGIVVYVQD